MKQLVFVLLALSVVVNANAQSANEEAPFLYYFSDELNAFVIERADGTDTTVLTKYAIPQQDHVISGPGWSASGIWFAWYSAVPTSGGTTNGDAMMVNHSGRQSFRVREQCAANLMKWLGTEDLILIGCYQTIESHTDYVYLVFDPNKREEILLLDSGSLGLSGDISDITSAYWTPGGNNLVIYHANSIDFDETDYTMKVFSLDGSLVTEREFYTKHLTISQPYWSNADNVIYVAADSGRIVVENFQHKKIIEFETSLDQIGWVDWSQNGDYAFVYGGELSPFVDYSIDPNPVWLLSVPDESLMLISETSRPLNLSRQAPRFYVTTTWSPSDDRGFFVDASSTVYMVMPNRSEVVILHERYDANREIYPQVMRWHHGGENLTVIEYSLSQYQGTLYDYDVSSNQLLNTVEMGITFDNFVYSPSEKYLAYSSADCDGICLLNSTTSAIVEMPFTYSPENIGTSMELLRHPQADWLIAAGNPDGAWRWLNVINPTTGEQRNLGECALTFSCFGWLPDREN